MTRRSRRVAPGLALAGLLATAGPLPYPAPDAAARTTESERDAWQERLDEARAELSRAEQRRDAAETAVDRMRHRRRPRGDARKALFAEREQARADAEAARRALDELLEQARRAGVPPGWLQAPAVEPAAAPE
jgi:hypothetical protein